jgi:hypothetical protein
VQHAAHLARQFVIMGDQHHRCTGFAPDIPQRIEHHRRRLGVQVAGWLVRQQQWRIISQRAGNSNALLLPPRKLHRAVIQPVGQAKHIQQVTRPLFRIKLGSLGKLDRQRDVFEGGQSRHQVKELEYKADLLVANLGQLSFAHVCDIHAVDLDPAFGRHVQPADQPQQRAFTAPRRADDAHHLVFEDRQVNTTHRVYHNLAQRQVFCQVRCA